MLEGDIDFNGYSGINLRPPTNPNDIATKGYADSLSQGGTGSSRQIISSNGTTTLVANDTELTANKTLNMTNHKISGLLPPTVGTDGVNRNYLDSQITTANTYTDTKTAGFKN